MLRNVINDIIQQKQAVISTDDYKDLICQEAVIGGSIFGKLKPNQQRSFFCLDEKTWVWHEQWQGEDGQAHTLVTSYEVRPTGAVKTQDSGKTFQKLSHSETINLRDAIQLYRQRVMGELYHQAV